MCHLSGLINKTHMCFTVYCKNRCSKHIFDVDDDLHNALLWTMVASTGWLPLQC